MRRWRRVWSEWREGLDVVRQGRAVGVVFAVTAITAVGDGIFGVMFVIWVKDALEGEALKLGWLQTCQAVGGLVGGVLGGYVGRRFAPERLFGLGLLVFDLFDLSLFNVQGGVYVVSGLLVLVALAPRRYRVAAPAKEAA